MKIIPKIRLLTSGNEPGITNKSDSSHTYSGKAARRIGFYLVSILIITLFSTVLFSQTLTFQGRLRDPSERTVEEGEYSLTFRIYAAETGGTELWSETVPDVMIHHGVFAVELGAGNGLGELSFDQTYWLGVSIEDEGELPVRMKLSTVPYSLAVRGTHNTFPSTGNAGIGENTPAAALYMSSEGAATMIVNTGSDAAAGYAFDNGGNRKWSIELDPIDNTLHIEEADSSRAVSFSANGRIGIGISEPITKLHIAGGDSADVALTVDGRLRSDNNDGGLWISDDRFIGGFDNDKFGIRFNDDWHLTIQADGNVGIGTETPGAKLDINGSLKLSSGGALIFNDGTSIATTTIGGSADSLTNAADAVLITDTDNDASGSFQMMTNNVTRMIIANNGNVGIGTTNPGSDLTVNGNINVSGSILNNGSAYRSIPWTVSGNNIYSMNKNIAIAPNYSGYKLKVDGIVNCQSLRVNGTVPQSPWYTSYTLNAFGYMYYSSGVVLIGRTNNYLNFTRSLLKNDFALYGPVYIGLSDEWTWEIEPNEPYIHPVINKNCKIADHYDPLYRLYAATVNYHTLYTISDRRVKQNIRPVSKSLEKVKKLRGVSYDINTATHPTYKDMQPGDMKKAGIDIMNTKNKYSFIAQEMMEVIPEMVDFDKDYELYSITNYEQLFPILVESIKELKVKNDALKQEATLALRELDKLIIINIEE